MSTSKETVAFLLAQLEPLDVRARAMFGEFGAYCDEKFVALVCDDTFFLKPTDAADGGDASRQPRGSGGVVDGRRANARPRHGSGLIRS